MTLTESLARRIFEWEQRSGVSPHDLDRAADYLKIIRAHDRAMIEKLRGMLKSGQDDASKARAKIHNAALDAVLKELEKP